MVDEMTLEIPVDPAFALTARAFVASIAQDVGIDRATVDDLRLAVSELVANAVEVSAHDPIRLAIAPDTAGLRLTVTGAGVMNDGVPVDRQLLLQTLFEEARFDEDGNVVIVVPAAS